MPAGSAGTALPFRSICAGQSTTAVRRPLPLPQVRCCLLMSAFLTRLVWLLVRRRADDGDVERGRAERAHEGGEQQEVVLGRAGGSDAAEVDLLLRCPAKIGQQPGDGFLGPLV